MRIKPIILLALPILLLTWMTFNPVYAAEEHRVLSRRYLGLGVEVYAPYQCYPNDTITVRVKVEALEDVKNASVTLFIWGSKSEGYTPWGTSFTVLEAQEIPNGTVQDQGYDTAIPSDISPGLTYGIIFLDWSVYLPPSWKGYWDKASFRATYVKNKGYEELQTTYNDLITTYDDLEDKYNSIQSQLQTIQTLMYTFLTTTIALTASTVYFAMKKSKAKRTSK